MGRSWRRAVALASLFCFLALLAGDTGAMSAGSGKDSNGRPTPDQREEETAAVESQPQSFEKENTAAPAKHKKAFPWLMAAFGAGAVVTAILLLSHKKKEPGPEFTPRVPEIEMVSIPGGTFRMGSTREMNPEGCWWPDEIPVHAVTLSSFRIGRYEVTQGQWRALMGENPEDYWRGENYPAGMLAWEQCQEFIQRLNQMTGRRFRLPTEAEWEYACRGGSSRDPYGSPNEIGWFFNNSLGSVHPVGQKLANGFGLYDMLGNVNEWCQDWYGDYPAGPQVNPTGPASGSCRVARGAGYANSIRVMRAANRHLSSPLPLRLGFRLVEDVSGL